MSNEFALCGPVVDSNDLHVGSDDQVEKKIALYRIKRIALQLPQDKVAPETELCARCRQLAAVVGLNRRPGDSIVAENLI